jgi:hypothetical protein
MSTMLRVVKKENPEQSNEQNVSKYFAYTSMFDVTSVQRIFNRYLKMTPSESKYGGFQQ